MEHKHESVKLGKSQGEKKNSVCRTLFSRNNGFGDFLRTFF